MNSEVIVSRTRRRHTSGKSLGIAVSVMAIRLSPKSRIAVYSCSSPFLPLRDGGMKMRRALSILCAATSILMGVGLREASCLAQGANSSPISFPGSKQVLGLEGLKHNASGTLSVENGSLVFTKGNKTAVVPAASITEVLTGKDTERTIGGTVGTLTLFAPYGSGRFLSLFRTKIDTLAIEYLDPAGGIHGAVFTLRQGNALGAKQALLNQGAKTSVPIEVEAEAQAHPKAKKQQ
jgi:hypothetical protein